VKTASQAASEIKQLSEKHKLLQFSFVDNLLPAKITRNVFQKLREQKADYSFFGEFRAGIKSEDLLSMRNGGLEEIQVGIEALSTRLLKKMNKGTSAIDNLEIMKNCEELGIFHDSNLILQFPGSEIADVEETLENLDFAFVYRPLKTIAFWLGYGSPVWEEPGRYGIRARFNHPFYSDLFPRSVSREIPFIIQSYRGDIQKQRKLWEPVKQKVRQWSDSYRSLRRGFNAPILYYRDGKDFLIIRKRVKQDETQTHRLTGSSRNIYLFCRKQRSLNRIVKTFPAFSRSQLENFLRSMVKKKLMFTENDCYLSLAVSRNPSGTSGEKC
jgi:hypothetical protein